MEQLSPKWISQIKLEYQRLQRNEEVLHNQVLHRRILKTWREQSPAMWGRLQAAKLTEALAFVMQQRMWQMTDELEAAGYPPTDAREQAEAEHLMLEPEADLQQREADRLEEMQRRNLA